MNLRAFIHFILVAKKEASIDDVLSKAGHFLYAKKSGCSGLDCIDSDLTRWSMLNAIFCQLLI